MRRVVPVALACLVLAVLTPQLASAGFADGADEVHRGSGTQGAYWNGNAIAPTLTIYVITGAINNSRCLDAFFDWRPGAGHWDGRLVRNCRDNGYRDTNSFGEPYNAPLDGARTAAGCIFYQATKTYSPSPGAAADCTKMNGALNNATDGNAWEWSEVAPDKFLQGWVRWANGDAAFKSGGDAWSATS